METFKLQLRRLLVTAIVLFFAWFVWSFRATFALALQLAPAELLLILFCYLCINLLAAFMACRMLQHRGRVVPLWRMLTINAWANLLAQVSVSRKGPVADKSQLYRRLHQVPVTVSLGVLAFLSLAMIFANSALGILTGVWATVMEGVIIPPLYWLVLSSTMLLCLSIVLGIYKLGGVYKLPRSMQIWVANLHAVFSGTNAKEILGTLLMVVLSVPVQVLALGLLCRAFGQDLSLVYLIFIAVFSSLAQIISLTPGNLGIRELIVLLLVAHLDISAVAIVSILLTDRLLQFAVVSLLGLSGYARFRQVAPVPPPALAERSA